MRCQHWIWIRTSTIGTHRFMFVDSIAVSISTCSSEIECELNLSKYFFRWQIWRSTIGPWMRRRLHPRQKQESPSMERPTGRCGQSSWFNGIQLSSIHSWRFLSGRSFVCVENTVRWFESDRNYENRRRFGRSILDWDGLLPGEIRNRLSLSMKRGQTERSESNIEALYYWI